MEIDVINQFSELEERIEQLQRDMTSSNQVIKDFCTLVQKVSRDVAEMHAPASELEIRKKEFLGGIKSLKSEIDKLYAWADKKFYIKKAKLAKMVRAADLRLQLLDEQLEGLWDDIEK